MLGDHQRPRHVPGRYGLAQLEVVVVLRDADVGLDVGVGDALRAFGQRDDQFAQFVRDFRNVGAQVVGQHRQRLRVNGQPFSGDELLEPRGDLVVARAHRLEHRAVGGATLVEGRTPVGVFLLVADYEDRRRRRLLGVERELVQSAQLLRLLEDDDLVGSHHRHLAAEVDDLPRLGVPAVDGELVESPFGFAQHGRGYLLGDGVDEVALFAHEQVDGDKPPCGDLAGELFICGDGILEFQCAFSHVRRFLW